MLKAVLVVCISTFLIKPAYSQLFNLNCIQVTLPFVAEISTFSNTRSNLNTSTIECGSDVYFLRAASSVNILQKNTFRSMENLYRLDITDCYMREVRPGFIRNPKSLIVINFSRNRLSTIRAGVFVKSLTSLLLNNNDLESIEENAFSNIFIEYLELSTNNISTIENWFRNVTILRLHLNNNQITSLRKDTFREIRGLEDIYLDNNRIQYIEVNTFPNMKELHLARNYLYNIDFLGRTVLETLDIGFNRISCFRSFVILTKIKRLLIYPNPWNCNCLLGFWKLAWRYGIGYGDSQLFQQKSDTNLICLVAEHIDEQDKKLHEENFMRILYN